MLLFSDDNFMCLYLLVILYVIVERRNFDDYCGITALIVWDVVFFGDEITSYLTIASVVLTDGISAWADSI